MRNEFGLKGICAFIYFLSIGAVGKNAVAYELEFRYSSGKSSQKVYLMSDLSYWQEDPRMLMRETSPGTYSIKIQKPWLPEMNYKFQVDGTWFTDPSNSDRVSDGYGGNNSHVDLKFTEDPELYPHSGTAKWTRTEIKLIDQEGSTRSVFLVAPKLNAVLSAKRKAVVYFQDGGDYLDRAQVEPLLANLSARSDMPTFYGVFVPPKDRDREYGLTSTSDAYVQFMVQTVVPSAEQNFGLSLNAEDRLLVGPSLGGVITLYTAFRYPDVFNFAASQSAAEDEDQINNVLYDLISNPLYGKPKKLFVEIGIFEPADYINFTHHVRDLIKNTGIEMKYQEFPTTHDWFGWRNRLNEIISYFFKSKS